MADLDDLLDSVSLDELESTPKASKSQNDDLDDLLDGVFDAQSNHGGGGDDGNKAVHPSVETFHNICLTVLAKMNKLPPPACMNKTEGDYGVLIKKLGEFYGEELVVDGIKSKLEGESGLGKHSKKLMSS